MRITFYGCLYLGQLKNDGQIKYIEIFLNSVKDQVKKIKAVVIFLDFHQAKQGLSLVDSWSRGLD